MSIHHLTHRHTALNKPGVGEIVLCRSRIADRIGSIHIRPEGNEAWTHLDGTTADTVARICSAETADELRALLRQGEHQC